MTLNLYWQILLFERRRRFVVATAGQARGGSAVIDVVTAHFFSTLCLFLFFIHSYYSPLY
jgi:hypothetical protein